MNTPRHGDCLVLAALAATISCSRPTGAPPSAGSASAASAAVPALVRSGPAASSITVLPVVPPELNPPYVPGPPASGGAPSATPEQAAAFAWQEFIALNWPAGPQSGQPGQRDAPSPQLRFGDPSYAGPTVWETFRGKVETFPGNGAPPGYMKDATRSYGYDALPQYNYKAPVNACESAQARDGVPWVNLDETDQIQLDNMYAGAAPTSSPNNSSPQLVRFLAKSNRTQYVYVAANAWWDSIPANVVNCTKDYLAEHEASPPAGSADMVSQPYNTIEVKAAWRPLNPGEVSSGRFHTQTVRFYEKQTSTCYRDATWGLIALHIIQKTPSAPYFVYATFEQADNLLAADGRPVEDADGNLLQPPPETATTPQVCLNDPRPSPPDASSPSKGARAKADAGDAGLDAGQCPEPPDASPPSESGEVRLTTDPTTCQRAAASFCSAPGKRLYYRNEADAGPSEGNICVNRRDNPIPSEVIAANAEAHAAIAAYLKQVGIGGAPWLTYKLVNVQYFPYDKVIASPTPNGSLYDGRPPYSAQHPSPSTYYQANIVVETNRSLQLFSGGLSRSPTISTDWNQDDTQHKNMFYGGAHYNMGGCMGCHGSQGQNRYQQAGDFSVILAVGHVDQPEFPAAETRKGLATVPRNRSLSR